MIWWCKARAVPALLATLIATITLGFLIGDAKLPVPALTGASGDFLLGHLITLAPAIVLLYGTGRGDLATETVASRPLRAWDTALAGAIGLLGLSAAAVSRLVGGDGITTVLGRNLAGYTALALLLMPSSATACPPRHWPASPSSAPQQAGLATANPSNGPGSSNPPTPYPPCSSSPPCSRQEWRSQRHGAARP